jgi:hypothetical protein
MKAIASPWSAQIRNLFAAKRQLRQHFGMIFNARANATPGVISNIPGSSDIRQAQKKRGMAEIGHAPELQPALKSRNYIFGAASEASAAMPEASAAMPEASAAIPEASAAMSVDSTAASVGVSAGFSEQPARAKAVPATAARRSLRMRYNPWIEVDRDGHAARRKAYSYGRLRPPINQQFISLQALDA